MEIAFENEEHNENVPAKMPKEMTLDSMTINKLNSWRNFGKLAPIHEQFYEKIYTQKLQGRSIKSRFIILFTGQFRKVSLPINKQFFAFVKMQEYNIESKR